MKKLPNLEFLQAAVTAQTDDCILVPGLSTGVHQTLHAETSCKSGELKSAQISHVE